MIRSLEIFAGAGGQALGVERAGFLHEAVIERDPNACATLKRNQQADRRITRHWNIIEGKVEDFDFRPFAGIDLLSGGPPCQPFSLGGKHQGHRDSRNLFPEMVRAVNEASPKALLIENVKGLLRDSFRDYFRYILMQLRFPEFRRLKDEI